MLVIYGPTSHILTQRQTSFGQVGGCPKVVVSTAAFHARVRGSFTWPKEKNEMNGDFSFNENRMK